MYGTSVSLCEFHGIVQHCVWAFVKLLISAYFTGELTQRDPQEVREEGP